MITHSITTFKKEPPKQTEPSTKFVGTYGTEGHKKFIHSRVLEHCTWDEGMACSLGKEQGVVVHVYDETEYNDVMWSDLECQCVEVFLYSQGDTIMCHPNRLRTR